MPEPTSFTEIQRRLQNAKHRKCILLMLIEHIDSNFLPAGGTEPKQKLLDDNKTPVPVETFEAIASDTLNAEVEQLDAQISQIMNAYFLEAPPPSPPPSSETTEAQPVQEQA